MEAGGLGCLPGGSDATQAGVWIARENRAALRRLHAMNALRASAARAMGEDTRLVPAERAKSMGLPPTCNRPRYRRFSSIRHRGRFQSPFLADPRDPKAGRLACRLH